ncbi:deoxyribodipyrimidine photo-lyase [Corynebacterium sp.]|uniref:cryptochrome/photolyase family protein n=1 Tax=Corynebacterium sp. TaxID=1720 RepID=UPI002A91B59F|nr:deoxyribodipyrimidine photo-lyase [Corynebacterium sp.]MDY5785780.1 deoxyribodipyrimidine photo-lyase [Corynebacterium sp.]
MPSPTIVWFRDDLRATDNPALSWAAERGPVIGLYIHETVGRPLGAAAAWWLRRSLDALRESLDAPLIECEGDPREILPRIAREHGAAVTWNRRYRLREVDEELKASLGAVSHPGFLLAEPWELSTSSSGAYRVFTPFYSALRARLVHDFPQPLPRPEVSGAPVEPVCVPRRDEPAWTHTLARHNTPGEDAALVRFHAFLDGCVNGERYDNNDLTPGATSGLSAHLRFGEISPRYIWAQCVAACDTHPSASDSIWAFLRQLAWRDFAWHRLYHPPDLAVRNVRAQFVRFPWEWTQHAVPGSTPRAFAHAEMDPQAHHLTELAAWQSGHTGVPLVDAGMKQLWETGTMHNRVRMVVGSWLTKNLGIHWRHGEEWFWDTLVDADDASNPFNWQWVAGCGDDAAPYFRIFNPLTQREKFDPQGRYVARWAPEACLPGYPEPMVDIKASRAQALAAYEIIKG